MVPVGITDPLNLRANHSRYASTQKMGENHAVSHMKRHYFMCIKLTVWILNDAITPGKQAKER